MPRCSSRKGSARSPRKILRAISSSRRGSTLIWCCLLFVAFFRKTQKVSRTDRRWLRFHLFASQNPGAFHSTNLRSRYLETTELAASYTNFLDTLNGMRRLDEIRAFRSLDYGAKKERILALMDASPRQKERILALMDAPKTKQS